MNLLSSPHRYTSKPPKYLLSLNEKNIQDMKCQTHKYFMDQSLEALRYFEDKER